MANKSFLLPIWKENRKFNYKNQNVEVRYVILQGLATLSLWIQFVMVFKESVAWNIDWNVRLLTLYDLRLLRSHTIILIISIIFHWTHKDFSSELLVIMLIDIVSKPKIFPITCHNILQQTNSPRDLIYIPLICWGLIQLAVSNENFLHMKFTCILKPF